MTGRRIRIDHVCSEKVLILRCGIGTGARTDKRREPLNRREIPVNCNNNLKGRFLKRVPPFLAKGLPSPLKSGKNRPLVEGETDRELSTALHMLSCSLATPAGPWADRNKRNHSQGEHFFLLRHTIPSMPLLTICLLRPQHWNK